MSYTVNHTDGSIFATVSDGTTNTQSSVTLIGKNYDAGYGAFIAENFIHLLENGANLTAPANPLAGELWFDSTEDSLKVFNGTLFKTLIASTIDSVEPTTSVSVGDTWFDTANNQLNIYDGTNFILVGPAFTSTEGTSGAIVDTIADNLATDHVVIKSYVEGVVVAVTSKDAPFTVGTPFTGFTGTISPGIQLATTVVGGTPQFLGKATDTDLFDGALPSTFLKSNTNDTTSGTLGILNDGGITIGADQDLDITVVGVHTYIENKNDDGDIVLQVKGVGNPDDVITINGTTSRAEVSDPLISNDIANKGYVDAGIAAGVLNMLKKDGSVTITGDITPSSDVVRDFGSGALRFQTIYSETFDGNATNANQLNNLSAAYYVDADNMNAGTLPSARLTGTYTIDVSGNATTADSATDVAGYVPGDSAGDLAIIDEVPGVDWTTRIPPVDNQWMSVTYGKGLFVAVSNSGTSDRVMSSQDGLTWLTQTSAADNTWAGVTYGGGQFVAVASAGTNLVMISPDGRNWTAYSTPTTGWVDVVYGNGTYVATASLAGTSPKIMSSTNGTSWTNRYTSAYRWESVVYGAGTFVAIGPGSGVGNKIVTSPDGITWTPRTVPEDNQWESVTYGKGLFVAVSSTGTANHVMTSPDGITWTTRIPAHDTQWESVTYGNGLFVAVSRTGVNDRVMTSPDGITWTTRTSAADNQWQSVFYGNGLFVSVSNSGTANHIMTSGTMKDLINDL